MGVNDTGEMLAAARAECERLEGELEAANWALSNTMRMWRERAERAEAKLAAVAEAVSGFPDWQVAVEAVRAVFDADRVESSEPSTALADAHPELASAVEGLMNLSIRKERDSE